jgi:hypothetical protein
MTPYDLRGGSMVPYMSLQNDKNVATEEKTIFATMARSLTTKPGVWEHVAFEVDNLDPDKTMATQSCGCRSNRIGDFIWTHDPDGALMQIVDAKSGGATTGQKLKPLKR